MWDGGVGGGGIKQKKTKQKNKSRMKNLPTDLSRYSSLVNLLYLRTCTKKIVITISM
jgi:hypothetical protein